MIRYCLQGVVAAGLVVGAHARRGVLGDMGKPQAIVRLFGQGSIPHPFSGFHRFRTACREWWQRDWLWKEGVGAHARRGDLIILGDVDEIPRPETLAALRACPFEGKHNCANLDGSFFYYSYSGYAGEWLAGPKVRLAVTGILM